MKYIPMKALLPLCVLLAVPILAGCQTADKSTIDKSTVRQFDLAKYMGRWYEIARFDHRFERGLVGVTADYTLLPNGKVRVVNSGYENDLTGKLKTITGKARQPDPLEPGRLEVSFFPLIYSDYNILELDGVHDSYALVGSSSDDYLWILSRTAALPESNREYLLQKAKARGYDTSRLLWTPQPKIRQEARSTSAQP